MTALARPARLRRGRYGRCAAMRWSAGTGERVGRRAAADRPAAPARQVGAEQILEQFARGGQGAGARLRWPNPRARRSGAPRRCRDRASAKLANLATVRVGIERPEGGLQHLHRQRAERVGGGLRALSQMSVSAARRCVGISGEMPRRGEGREPLDRGQVGGGDGHRPAEAIADQARRLAELARAAAPAIASTWPATSVRRARGRRPSRAAARGGLPRQRGGERRVGDRGRGCAAG